MTIPTNDTLNPTPYTQEADIPSVILGVELAANHTSVALYYEGHYSENNAEGGREQTKTLLPAIDALLTVEGLTVQTVGGVAFSHGPGSFTGLRVACSITQALAYAQDLPVVGISSLKALAWSAFKKLSSDDTITAETGATFVCCVDAKMGEVYWAVYRLHYTNECSAGQNIMCDTRLDRLFDNTMLTSGLSLAYMLGVDVETLVPDSLAKPEEFLQAISAYQSFYKLGDGWQLQAINTASDSAPLTKNERQLCALTPKAQDIIELALPLFACGETVDAEGAQPVYLRGKNAWKTLSEQREQNSEKHAN